MASGGGLASTKFKSDGRAPSQNPCGGTRESTPHVPWQPKHYHHHHCHHHYSRHHHPHHQHHWHHHHHFFPHRTISSIGTKICPLIPLGPLNWAWHSAHVFAGCTGEENPQCTSVLIPVLQGHRAGGWSLDATAPQTEVLLLTIHAPAWPPLLAPFPSHRGSMRPH